MRIDAGVIRLQTAINRLNSTARESETAEESSIVNLFPLSNSPPVCLGFFNIVSTVGAIVTDPASGTTQSKGHSSANEASFDGSSSAPPSSYPLQTDEFCFHDNKGILLNRIVILSKDESILNGSVIGQTTPSPSACLLSVWCSDLLTVRGRLIRLQQIQSTSQPLPGGGGSNGGSGNRNSSGGLWFVPPTIDSTAGRLQIVTDRILVQGNFEKLTLCVYGWPVDVDNDERFTAAKR